MEVQDTVIGNKAATSSMQSDIQRMFVEKLLQDYVAKHPHERKYLVQMLRVCAKHVLPFSGETQWFCFSAIAVAKDFITSTVSSKEDAFKKQMQSWLAVSKASRTALQGRSPQTSLLSLEVMVIMLKAAEDPIGSEHIIPKVGTIHKLWTGEEPTTLYASMGRDIQEIRAFAHPGIYT